MINLSLFNNTKLEDKIIITLLESIIIKWKI